VFGQDLLDVLPVHVGVPGRLGIDHEHRTLGATVQAPRRIDANASGTRDVQLPGTPLQVIAQLRRIAPGATLAAVVPPVGAEKYMITVNKT